jgi:serine phosphatase RsbU (regulator of sigma subunit)
LDTARLYSREHEVATVLQQSILPEALPDFPELGAASVYAPAGEDTEIGGDYYDLFRVKDGSIWFAIADVAGKGVEAATKTSMIKYALRSFAAAGLQPAEVLGELNRMTAESGDPSEIVTVWVGRYIPSTGGLEWANGGHPAGLVKRAGGGFARLATTGPLLGAIAEVTYEQESIALECGDEILLYTDGVTEARRGNVFFGEERVRESFERSTDTLDAARDLLESVRGYVETELRDDIAILVLGVASPRPEDGTE